MDTAKHPTQDRPSHKEYLTQEVNSAKVENPAQKLSPEYSVC